jgi:hypothetical protein
MVGNFEFECCRMITGISSAIHAATGMIIRINSGFMTVKTVSGPGGFRTGLGILIAKSAQWEAGCQVFA